MAATATILFEGRLTESNELVDNGREKPYVVTFGKTSIMPAIERELAEMKIGEERIFNLTPAEAFGEWDAKGVQKVFLRDIPHGEDLPVGEYISWKNPVSLKPIPVKVISKRNGIAEFDMNHPLAGKHLTYWVKVVDRSQ